MAGMPGLARPPYRPGTENPDRPVGESCGGHGVRPDRRGTGRADLQLPKGAFIGAKAGNAERHHPIRLRLRRHDGNAERQGTHRH